MVKNCFLLFWCFFERGIFPQRDELLRAMFKSVLLKLKLQPNAMARLPFHVLRRFASLDYPSFPERATRRVISEGVLLLAHTFIQQTKVKSLCGLLGGSLLLLGDEVGLVNLGELGLEAVKRVVDAELGEALVLGALGAAILDEVADGLLHVLSGRGLLLLAEVEAVEFDSAGLNSVGAVHARLHGLLGGEGAVDADAAGTDGAAAEEHAVALINDGGDHLGLVKLNEGGAEGLVAALAPHAEGGGDVGVELREEAEELGLLELLGEVAELEDDVGLLLLLLTLLGTLLAAGLLGDLNVAVLVVAKLEVNANVRLIVALALNDDLLLLLATLLGDLGLLLELLDSLGLSLFGGGLSLLAGSLLGSGLLGHDDALGGEGDALLLGGGGRGGGVDGGGLLLLGGGLLGDLLLLGGHDYFRFIFCLLKLSVFCLVI